MRVVFLCSPFRRRVALDSLLLAIVCALLSCAGVVYAGDQSNSLRIARPAFPLNRIERAASVHETASCCSAKHESPCASPCDDPESLRFDIGQNESCCAHESMGQNSMAGPSTSKSCCDANGAGSRISRSSTNGLPQYFSLNLSAPQKHFGQWLKLSVYPTLCSTVLCQRQCSLNGYESCNALGVKRSILLDAFEGGGGCGPEGCRTGENVSALSDSDRSSSRFSKAEQLVTTGGAKSSGH